MTEQMRVAELMSLDQTIEKRKVGEQMVGEKIAGQQMV